MTNINAQLAGNFEILSKKRITSRECFKTEAFPKQYTVDPVYHLSFVIRIYGVNSTFCFENLCHLLPKFGATNVGFNIKLAHVLRTRVINIKIKE